MDGRYDRRIHGNRRTQNHQCRIWILITITLTLSNTGTTSVIISQVSIDNAVQGTDAITLALSDGTDVTDTMALPKNAKGAELVVTLEDDFVSGNSYAMKIVTTKGNYYAYNAICP